MVTVGTLNVVGTMDTSDINSGFRQIDNGFEQSREKGQRANATFDNMAATVGGLASGLGMAATAGAGFMGAMASQAPQVAPAMAKMQIEAMKMSHTLGRSLSPVFNTVANELLPALGQALDKVNPKIKDVSEGVSEDIGNLSGSLKGDIEDLKELIPVGTGLAAGASAGMRFGRPFLGAALGYAAAKVTESDAPDKAKEEFGVFAESMHKGEQTKNKWGDFFSGLGEVWGNPYGWYTNPKEQFGNYMETGAEGVQATAMTAQTGINMIWDIVQWTMSSNSEKNSDMQNSDGQPKGGGG